MVVLNDFSTSVRRALDEIDKNWESYPGLIVCGTHNPHDVEDMIGAIRINREARRPFLGICAGFQYATIEWARNICGIKDATSEEFGQPGTFVVKKSPNLKVGGYYPDGTRWNNYEVDFDWTPPENYFVTQAHPEYESRIGKPHPLLKEFIEYAKLAM